MNLSSRIFRNLGILSFEFALRFKMFGLICCICFSIRNTLPFQLISLFKAMVVFLIRLLFKTIKDCWNREPKPKENVRPR